MQGWVDLDSALYAGHILVCDEETRMRARGPLESGLDLLHRDLTESGFRGKTDTDGQQADILTLEMGGTRAPFTLAGAQAGDHQKVVMKGREVFREAVHRMTSAARAVLDEAGVAVADLALVVPHQANLRIIKAVQKALGLADDKLVINVDAYGNTGSASVPLALWEARGMGRIQPGDLVLLTAFGAGFHWASMLLKF